MKVVQGTARPDRDAPRGPVFPPLNDRSPPDWLDADARVIWHDLAERLHDAGVLTVLDAMALGHLCMYSAMITRRYANGQKVLASELAELRRWYAEFGLTLASAGVIAKSKRVVESPGIVNPFAVLGDSTATDEGADR